ncbi:MAG: helix-turn-helix transcriptional regulator [Verrucomicrobiota bacterium]
MRKDADRKKLAKKLGRNIARARSEAKLTQEKVAELTDIHDRHFQKIEGGEVCPSFPLIVEIKKKLKAEWSDILKGIG